MKIISPGKPVSNWWGGIKVMCPHCKSVLELEHTDRVVELTWVDNQPWGRIGCIHCRKIINIEPGKSLP